jgi:starch synthase
MIPQVTLVVPGRWHAFDFARELQRLGALHRIVTNYPKSRTRRWGIPDEKVVSLPLTLVLTKAAWKFGGDSFATRQNFRINNLFARAAARKLGTPDVVHAWSGTAEPSIKAARGQGIVTVLERSSSHMLEQRRILREEYDSLGLRWEETPRASVERELREYELVDRVFVPSLFVERSFVAHGFPAHRLFRNGFGVDISRFKPGKKADNVFRVIYAGALSVRKGIHHLAEAFRAANVPAGELLLVGGPSQETDRLIGNNTADVRRVGHVPQSELPTLYQTASVFAMASLEEGQAYVQAQALACGLPLVCTTNTGGEDFLAMSGTGIAREGGITEYPAGYLVPAGESAAMAMALRALATDPVRLLTKQTAAARLAERDLSWARYADANLGAYRQLLADSSKS